jgi:alkanesulfonate monooxygenase SsuD/methylene tetrahydromethanopterin reductase-like flavin-dependent oxidoreductase (luciferase family)
VKIGLFGINTGACADPQVALRVARAAEDAGFDSVWTAEHVVLPDPQAPPSPVPPETSLLDPAVALAHIAAATERIQLGTGIIILPQRNPLVLAKELATLDVVSNGRLIFGLGTGYLKAEFDALGIPFEERGARTSEAIEVLRTLWTQRSPHPPIFVGGHSPPAYRRAVAQGNGWYGFALDVDAAASCIRGLAEAAERVERPASLGTLELSVTPSVALGRDTVRRYEDLGVSRLVAIGRGDDGDTLVRFVERTAETLL